MLSNNEVIKRFANRKSGSNRNLKSDGNKLINYYTCIAQWVDGEIVLNETKYSVSTSKIQRNCRYYFGRYKSVSGLNIGVQNLIKPNQIVL